jgi:hypothetical protein
MLAKRTATKVSRIVDNHWPRRKAPPLDRKVFAFDSGSTWPVSASPCPLFSAFCAARLISSIFLSSAATTGWLFRSSAVSCISLVLLISAFFKIFVSIYPSRLILTQPDAPDTVATLRKRNAGGLVVLEPNSHLLSSPAVPIHFFRALSLKQLVPRHVLLDLVIRHYRLRRLERW